MMNPTPTVSSISPLTPSPSPRSGARGAITIPLLAVVCLFCTVARAQDKEPDDKRTPEVKKFVEHYFATWSKPDIDAYADCFLNDAVIQFIDQRGQLHSQGKRTFIAEQRQVQAKNPGVEVPESIEIRFEPNLARAIVYWKLTMGKRVEYGYDHFTLARQEGKWKIVNLVFYKVEPEK